VDRRRESSSNGLRMVRQTAFLVIVLGVLAAPQAAWSGEKEEARKHYDRAVELVDDGQLEGAIVEFQRSYDLTRHFAVLYNIGQVFVSLARPVEAVDAYERYLADGGKRVPPARRAEVEKEIVRQKARIATLEFRGLPRGAIVRVDGNEIGRAPISASVRVGVGKHTLAASAEGYDSAEKEVIVAGEDHKVVELALAKHVVETPPPPSVTYVVSAPPPASPAVAPAPRASAAGAAVEPSTRPMSNVRLLGILTGVAGVAGIAAGGACWWVGMSRNDESKDNWSTNPDKAQSLRGEAQDYLTAGNTLFYGGGALVALGVVLYIVGAPDDHPATPSTHAHLMPTLRPGFAGLSAGGTW
jgi:hypothetical protein